MTPVSTYRLQLHEGFTFDEAVAHVEYLADLGVTHLYLSPILQSVPGSLHGYDVLDHTRVDRARGGREGLERLAEAARSVGLGIILDVVPNHMALPQPAHLNAPLWSLLREGWGSPYAAWFDVDWDVEDDRILMPVLGASIEQVVASGELHLADDGGPTGAERVVRYYDNEFPLGAGTADLPLAELLDAQAYRLANWREGGEGLNYRRFFDVTSLVAVRVEDPVVFAATHALLVSLVAHGIVDGLRIDHPDGLADPDGYLEALARSTGRAWVVVEKILEGQEQLRPEWACAGTTGYDAMLAIQQVLTSGGGEQVLDRLWRERAPQAADLSAVVVESKELVIADVQAAEVDRLMRILRRVLPEEDAGYLRIGLEAMLVGMDRYRAYLSPDGVSDPAEYEVLARAEEAALALVGHGGRAAVQLIAQVARGARLAETPVDSRTGQREFMVRFQQTCGPVMAKGIEDTAFYRWLRLAGANEVGGHPQQLSRTVEDFHRYAQERLANWPVTMTGLTTHDTKRSEDVRARLMTLSSDAVGWARWIEAATALAGSGTGVDPVTQYLVWQTLIGTWPITTERLCGYLLKAVREAKTHTAWVDGDAAYEEAVTDFATRLLVDPRVMAHVEDWLAEHAGSIRSNVLSQKLIQLTMPGVCDVYQGAERQVLTLVDPDNRHPVDFAERARRLRALDAGHEPVDLDDEKLLLTSRALRLRRDHPEWFVDEQAGYEPIDIDSQDVLAFARGDESGAAVVSVALLRGVVAADIADIEIKLPPGRWRHLVRGSADPAGALVDGHRPVRLGDLLGGWPVALLQREKDD